MLHLRTATEAYEAHRYEVAAREFEVAWELSHNPALLFNAGNAWERVPDVDHALVVWRRYVVEVPDGPSTPDARARIDVLERTRVSQQPPTAPPPRPTALAAPSVVSRSHGWRYVAITTGVLGLVSGLAATGLYLATASDFRQLRDTCAPRCAQTDADGIDRRATATNVLIGVSGVLLAAAATSLVIDLVGGRAARVSAVALPLPGGAAVGVGGRL